MKIVMRAANESDLPAMVAIKHDAGVAAWPHILPPEVIEQLPFPERWVAAIVDPDPRVGVLLADADDRAVAFAVTRPSGDVDAGATIGELDAFFSDPAAWGSGVGRSLLAAAVEVLRLAGFREATLWTAELNHRPRRIYECAGWARDGADRPRSFGGVEFAEVRYRIGLGPSP